jgi:hypothetical protein
MSLKLHTVTAYDEDFHDRFCRWRRARWALAVADFAASSAHVGDGDGEIWRFGLRAIASRRRWALTLEHGRRRFAAVVVAPRPTCAEEIAAVALAAIAADGGPKVARVVDAGGLDREAFERFWAPLAPGRRREGQAAGAVSVSALPAANAGAAAASAVGSEASDQDDDPPAPILQSPAGAEPAPAPPADAVWLCLGTGSFSCIGLRVDLYMHRADGVDVLWEEIEDAEVRPLGQLPSTGDLAAGGLRLLAAALRAGFLLNVLPDTLRGKAVSTADAVGVWQREHARRDRWAATAAKHADAPIVVAARELGLDPSPSGTGPWSWNARCPGTRHSLMVQAKSGDFGCGWCKKRGGVAELRAFAAEREPARQ